MATAYLRVSLLMGIPIPHTLVQTSKISVGSLSKIVAALYITGRDSRLKSVIAHPRCLIKKEGGLTNAHFHKNKKREDIKSHHYIISYDPADVTENGLTGERAQAISLELAKQMFPGYQALVVTHTDGHNESGNIHTHIVINSVRKTAVERQPYMDKPHEEAAGYKHRSDLRILNDQIRYTGQYYATQMLAGLSKTHVCKPVILISCQLTKIGSR